MGERKTLGKKSIMSNGKEPVLIGTKVVHLSFFEILISLQGLSGMVLVAVFIRKFPM